MSTAPRDGAHTRRDRKLDILSYIDACEQPPHGIQIQSMMSLRHGLTYARVTIYLRELEQSKTIRMDVRGCYKLTQPLDHILALIASVDPKE